MRIKFVCFLLCFSWVISVSATWPTSWTHEVKASYGTYQTSPNPNSNVHLFHEAIDILGAGYILAPENGEICYIKPDGRPRKTVSIYLIGNSGNSNTAKMQEMDT